MDTECTCVRLLCGLEKMEVFQWLRRKHTGFTEKREPDRGWLFHRQLLDFRPSNVILSGQGDEAVQVPVRWVHKDRGVSSLLQARADPDCGV